MKIYLIKRKNAENHILNFYPLSLVTPVGKNGLYPKAVHAFFRKKHAIEHLNSMPWNESTKALFEIISVTL